MFKISALLLWLFCFLVLGVPDHARAECYFRDSNGAIRGAKALSDVPEQYRSVAQCDVALGAPSQFESKGNKRKVEANSNWGRIGLFWTSDVEDKLPANPVTIVVGALKDAERFVSSYLGISTRDIPGGNDGWQIVIINNDAEVPLPIRQGCHPGWMTAPSNIYLYAKKIFADCGGRSLSAEAIKQNFYSTLIHEIGHVVEYGLIGKSIKDSQRAEGFAAWFESSIIPASKGRYLAAAKSLVARAQGQPTPFQGGFADYGLASAHFHALVDIKSPVGIREFYRKYKESPTSLPNAILSLGISRQRLEDSMNKLLK